MLQLLHANKVFFACKMHAKCMQDACRLQGPDSEVRAASRCGDGGTFAVNSRTAEMHLLESILTNCFIGRPAIYCCRMLLLWGWTLQMLPLSAASFLLVCGLSFTLFECLCVSVLAFVLPNYISILTSFEASVSLSAVCVCLLEASVSLSFVRLYQ